MRKIDEIIIHHSATKDSGTVSWGAIRKYHMLTNGWQDIGYHFGIELVTNGDISFYEILVGRPLSMSGGHTIGHNATTIGVCMVGDFDSSPPPLQQLMQLDKLIADLRIVFPGIKKLSFHRDYAPKTCPGKMFGKELLVNFQSKGVTG